VLLFDCKLPMRLREIAVLRIAVLSRSRYEWVQHVKIGRRFGLGDADFAAIEANEPAAGWSELDRMMLETANALETSNTLSDDLWARLSVHYDKAALLELLYILGAYKMSAWIFNAVGVQPER
jgi:alkylhydroperoxidase family enzyme